PQMSGIGFHSVDGKLSDMSALVGTRKWAKNQGCASYRDQLSSRPLLATSGVPPTNETANAVVCCGGRHGVSGKVVVLSGG
ncbi:MAG TPA: hypothetical protein VLA52_13835, partial [Thermohalobaculum sp.]|nr:hypothetical protein [Thermohalobaculum sp.]